MKKLCVALFMCIGSWVHAECLVYLNNDVIDKPLNDPLFSLLSDSVSCPTSVQELKQKLVANHLQIETRMVANRGRNNPAEGSFSFFESVYGQLASGQRVKKGDFFLGHFTALEGNTLVLDQRPEHEKLLIELIVWDRQKEQYNFYELRGWERGGVRWFYRGDSADAYKDNKWLYRKSPANEDHFGSRMRCSACHNSGGPILKEMSLPHNDWWTDLRPLILAPNHPDPEVERLIAELADADLLARDVRTGANKLGNSSSMTAFGKQLSLQEQLRPLFCTTEINLESSADEEGSSFLIPSAFWLNPVLGQINISVSRDAYNEVLETLDMNFPETSLRDADHAWLTPVKSDADLQEIQRLIKQGLISEEFAKAVLMIDFTHPVFSTERCDLLKLLPETNEKEWLSHFMSHLRKQSSKNKAAATLSDYLENPVVYQGKAMQEIHQYQQYLAQLLMTREGLKTSYLNLIALRKSVFTSELSQNPKGQILEPGFRVIFPESMV
ncbi:hypothetical protein [Legionella shakespearei]|uniref:Rod shape-determining protein MreB n=1 Tax=Legionella shakespearei DSM 23087 TaxID=1122169 RepID=A0A0W0YZJ6_9GAMM|nr:hypothetical protein [Legionella shakespearei]KTD62301.1 rod shape-determining protein MreB [Legionella shakespearei DSM 23087]